MKRLPRLLWNELMILARDSSVLFWIFLFPFFFMFMMLFAFGSGSSLPQQTIEIVDLDGSDLSRRYIGEIRSTFSGTESIPGDLREAREHDPVAEGASRITLPEGFGHALERRRPVQVTVSFAQDGLPAQLVVRVVRALTLRFEADVTQQPELVNVRSDARGAAPAVHFVHYVLTGTMVMAMMSAGMTSIAVALAYRRERNGFKMLACMPLGAPGFLLGMLLARLLVLVFAAFVLVLGAQHLFGVPLWLTGDRLLQGSVVMLLGGAMLLALGTALGARLGTSSAANFVTGLVYIALLFLCDLTMPMSAMPPDVRSVMAHLPPALFVDALRQVFILGEGLGRQLATLAQMAGWLVLFALVAVFTFRWHRQ
jgi:ABC-type multidrug transport system permease subunit